MDNECVSVGTSRCRVPHVRDIRKVGDCFRVYKIMVLAGKLHAYSSGSDLYTDSQLVSLDQEQEVF